MYREDRLRPVDNVHDPIWVAIVSHKMYSLITLPDNPPSILPIKAQHLPFPCFTSISLFCFNLAYAHLLCKAVFGCRPFVICTESVNLQTIFVIQSIY